MALTSPQNATGLFELDTQPELLLPFEGLGVDTAWELSLPLASNPFDFGTIADVLFTVEYTALDSPAYRSRVLRALGDRYRAERPFSLRNELPDAWFQLNNPCPGATALRPSFTVGPEDFAPNVHDVAIQHVTLFFARAAGASFEVPLEYLELVPAGAQTAVQVGPALSKNGVISTRVPEYRDWLTRLTGRPYGKWTLSLPNSEVLRGLLACDDLRDILLIITYTATTRPGPRDTVLSPCRPPVGASTRSSSTARTPRGSTTRRPRPRG